MNRFAWLIRRELWEHRAIWMAPLVVLGLLLLAALAGNVLETKIHIDADTTTSGGQPALTDEDVEELASIRGPEDLHKLERLEKLDQAGAGGAVKVVGPAEAVALVPEEERTGLLTAIYGAVAAALFTVLGIIGVFYALDALYADRRDRSVLFWKSLPLSDTETVLSKFCTAAVVIPLVAAAAAIVGQLVVAAGGSIKLGLAGGAGGLMWTPAVLGGAAATAIMLAVVSALWFAPMIAYLMLASAWAPKSPFLWASLPPFALSLLERIAFGSDHTSALLKHRLLAPLEALFRDAGHDDAGLRASAMIGHLADLLASPGTLAGLVVAAGLLAAVVWVRRYRDEST